MTPSQTPYLVDIRAEALTHAYYRSGVAETILQDVSFEVRRNQLVSLIGRSGCGKTTLLRLLMEVESPTSGRANLDSERVKGGVAYIPQEAELLEWRTLFENASLGLELMGDVDDDFLDGVRRLITDFQLSGHQNKLPAQLSGGQQQRVAVIRALASRPNLLFCDEPFASVDFVTRLYLNAKFKENCLVNGITTVFVTHNIEEAIYLSDTIHVLGGRPARIVETYPDISLSISPEDPVECRHSPEFGKLFDSIWKVLQAYGDHGRAN